MQQSDIAAACVMMQKDEDLLLEAWIVYHGMLFGIHNLSVYDNGSRNPKVHSILDRYESRGMFVDRSFNRPEHFALKGEVIGAHMRVLRDSRRYDFLFPLDCDEFLAVRTPTGFNTTRHAIHANLIPLRKSMETLKIENEFLNCPRRPGYYHLIYCDKTFYAADSFERTDHGFHAAGALLTDAMRKTRLAHVHYHNKSFGRLLRDATRKLEGFGINVSDLEGIRRIAHSRHLIRYFFMSETDYLNSFDDQLHIYQPDFLRLLAHLGVTNATLLKPCSDRQQIPKEILSADFDPLAYMLANPDLPPAEEDPLIHYSMFGHNEGRPTKFGLKETRSSPAPSPNAA